MSAGRRECSGAERGGGSGGGIDLGRLVAAVHDALDSEDTERCFHAWQDMARQARRMQLDDEQRAMIKAVKRRVGELLAKNHSKRVSEILDREQSKRVSEILDREQSKRVSEILDREQSKRVSEILDREQSKRVSEILDREQSKRVSEVLNRLADERMERRQKWYREVGIHRDFARDCARRVGFLSC